MTPLPGRDQDDDMATATILDSEEYIELAYFFRGLRERLGEGMATQQVLEQIDQEILSTTRLPYAIQFLAAELKHSGLLSSGFIRLPHYFTGFQAFVIEGSEEENRRFSIDTALVVLEREATYRAGKPTPSGLFIYQFEVLCRNRLGYDEGLKAMARDPFYDAEWKAFMEMTRQMGGVVEFAELVYVRSELYVMDRRRTEPGYEPSLPPLFGEKEGKIAKANRNRDPLFLFAALQRQLGYPEVPRPRPRDDPGLRLQAVEARLRDLENRLKLLEGEIQGKVDLTELGKPEILKDE
jgi:hypothetical protein